MFHTSGATQAARGMRGASLLDGVCGREEVRDGRTSVRGPDTEVVSQPDRTKFDVPPTEKL